MHFYFICTNKCARQMTYFDVKRISHAHWIVDTHHSETHRVTIMQSIKNRPSHWKKTVYIKNDYACLWFSCLG